MIFNKCKSGLFVIHRWLPFWHVQWKPTTEELILNTVLSIQKINSADTLIKLLWQNKMIFIQSINFTKKSCQIHHKWYEGYVETKYYLSLFILHNLKLKIIHRMILTMSHERTREPRHCENDARSSELKLN